MEDIDFTKLITKKQLLKLKEEYSEVATMAAALALREMEKNKGDFIYALSLIKGVALTGIVVGKYGDKLKEMMKERRKEKNG